MTVIALSEHEGDKPRAASDIPHVITTADIGPRSQKDSVSPYFEAARRIVHLKLFKSECSRFHADIVVAKFNLCLQS